MNKLILYLLLCSNSLILCMELPVEKTSPKPLYNLSNEDDIYISPSGEHIATSNQNGYVTIYDGKTGQKIYVLPQPLGMVAWNDCGSHFLTDLNVGAFEYKKNLVEAAKGKISWTRKGDISKYAFTADGKYILNQTNGILNDTRQLAIADKKGVTKFLLNHAEWKPLEIIDVASGSKIATVIMDTCKEWKIPVQDTCKKDSMIIAADATFTYFLRFLDRIKQTKDSEQILAITGKSNEKPFRIYKSNDDQTPCPALKALTGKLHAFSKEGETFAISDANNGINFYSRAFELLHRIQTEAPIIEVAFAPNSKKILVRHENYEEIHQGYTIIKWQNTKDRITHSSFNLDRTITIIYPTASESIVRIEALDGTLISENKYPVYLDNWEYACGEYVALAGKTVVEPKPGSRSFEEKTFIINTRNGNLACSIPAGGRKNPMHHHSKHFSEDGKFISGWNDNEIFISQLPPE